MSLCERKVRTRMTFIRQEDCINSKIASRRQRCVKYNMVTKARHIGFDNTPHIMMQRSKTSAQLKKKDFHHSGTMSPVQRNMKSGKQTYQYWKFNHNRQNATRKSSLGTLETNATPRRRSIDCTYQIGVWRLADELSRDNSTKVFEATNVAKENSNARNGSQVFPPIRSKSQHNIHLISKSKTVVDAQDASSTTPSNNSFDRKYSSGLRQSLQNGARSMTPDKYRNLSPIPVDKKSDEGRSKYWKSKFNREINLSTALSNLSAGAKHSQFLNSTKASSLHSRSSEGSSANTKVMMAKMSSRRRFSLPVSSTMPVMVDHELGKSPEFHKAFKQLAKNSEEETVHGLPSSTLSNSISLSNDVGPVYGNMSPKDSHSFSAFQSSTTMRRDSLQRIEEIPTEQIRSIPTSLVEEPNQSSSIYGIEQTDQDVSNPEQDKFTAAAENSIPVQDSRSNNIDVTQKSLHEHPKDFLNFEHHRVQHRDSNRDRSTGLFMAKQGNSRTNNVGSKRKDNDDTESDNKNVNRDVENDTKSETTTSADDKSFIDASILNEPDEDLCDADFREKRIIRWLINAETGDGVDEVVETTIPPSPPCGSMETAIKIIYAGN